MKLNILEIMTKYDVKELGLEEVILKIAGDIQAKRKADDKNMLGEKAFEGKCQKLINHLHELPNKQREIIRLAMVGHLAYCPNANSVFTLSDEAESRLLDTTKEQAIIDLHRCVDGLIKEFKIDEID